MSQLGSSWQIRQSFSNISPKGDGNVCGLYRVYETQRNFFKHFPERGWKRSFPKAALTASGTFSNISPKGDGNHCMVHWAIALLYLFQTFPRKGMETEDRINPPVNYPETFSNISPKGDGNFSGGAKLEHEHLLFFFKHFPERGWKRVVSTSTAVSSSLFQTFPRKGMETSWVSSKGK